MNKISFIIFCSGLSVFLIGAFLLKYIEVFVLVKVGRYLCLRIYINTIFGRTGCFFTIFTNVIVSRWREKQFLGYLQTLLGDFSIFIPLSFNVENAFIISLYIYSIANFIMYLIHYFLLIDAIRGFNDE
ncbi:hypothetical protein BANRA_01372 [Acinetobacter baumannii]|nr:hypothetical protein BANRA_01372 [Acinetobacter baumannii]